MRILLPKIAYDINPNTLIFLAGPVSGGGDWQAVACHEVTKRFTQPIIAVPCRWDRSHSLSRNFLYGEKREERQFDWEWYYMRKAADPKYKAVQSCLVFWVPLESTTNPRRDGLPYANDTKGELWLWLGHILNRADLRIVIGMDDNLQGMELIRHAYATKTVTPIYSTLEDTLDAAVEASLKQTATRL